VDRGDQRARKDRGAQTNPGAVRIVSNRSSRERTRQQQAFERNIDHARAFGIETPEGSQDQRRREPDG
jgi:hypothetical protein